MIRAPSNLDVAGYILTQEVAGFTGEVEPVIVAQERKHMRPQMRVNTDAHFLGKRSNMFPHLQKLPYKSAGQNISIDFLTAHAS